ncbi:hypothetical protein CBS101457_004094 [Exobasidium rhododendri]|nr:hypothetical protein CBS101457_004094 [Exobasidium rhododendri]
MADVEQQQDHAMGGQDEGGGASSEISPAGFYHRLQASLSKASDLFKEGQAQQQPITADAVADLVAVLQEKSELYHLTKEESLFCSALMQVQWALQIEGQGTNYNCEDVIAAHRALTSSSNASSANITAFVSYVSLLLALYYSYVEVVPVENELTMLSATEGEARDVVGQWIGLAKKGPLLYSDGRYQLESVPVAFSRKIAAGWGGDVIVQLDAVRGASVIREQLRDAYNQISGDVLNSQQVWSLYHQFEVTQLRSMPSPSEIEALQSIYFARLRTPHAQLDATLQSYSAFVTKYMPSKEYEQAMTNAYKLVGSAKEVWSCCEPYEIKLNSQMQAEGVTGYTTWAVWKEYLAWISNAYLYHPQKKTGTKLQFDMETVCAFYERAIVSCGLPPSCTEEWLAKGGRPLTKKQLASFRPHNESREARIARKEKDEEQVTAEREASLDLWKKYLLFLNSSKISSTVLSNVCSRASKAVPSAGTLHAQILRTFCRLRRSQAQIDEYFGAVLTNAGIASNATSYIDLIMAWIDVQRELAAGTLLLRGDESNLADAVGVLPLDTEAFMDLYSMMTFALTVVEEKGVVDQDLRLEHLISDWCSRGGKETAALAETVWEKALQVQSNNHLSWLGASRFYKERGIYKKARSLLKQALGKREIPSDKKVTVAEELLHFEHVHGGMSDIDWTLQKLDSERERVWTEYYTNYNVETAAVQQQQQEQQQQAITFEAAPEIDMVDGAVTGEKRRAEDEGSRQSASNSSNLHHAEKRGKETASKPAVRDRENSSVMVDSLPLDTTQDDILNIFKGCGEIREIVGPRVIDQASASALVEFTSRESIPAARSRQHKVVRDCRITIHLGWECTLYITNFAPEYDSDEKMRQLFHRFGKIFDVRWPSKKFANSRRFCYVQYCQAEAAQSALEMHGMEMTNGESGEMIHMQVLVSNPHRKLTRSDAQSSDRELFVTGLPKHVEEEELRALFGDDVVGIRIPKHPDGRNKGIAFVDMKTVLDAQKALGESRVAEGGIRIKGKLLSVSIADKEKSGKSGSGAASAAASSDPSEKRDHRIRVRGLPLDAQEAVIQQVIEAQAGVGTVKRVDWTAGEAGKGAAVIEFHDVAVSGKVGLMSSLMYDASHPLSIHNLETRISSGPVLSGNSDAPAAAPFAPRQAVRGRGGRGRGGLGYARRPPSAVIDASPSMTGTEMDVDTNANASSTPRKTQDSFRDMLKQGK